MKDHVARDIGTVIVAGVTIRVCGYCQVAVDQHPTAEALAKETTNDGRSDTEGPPD